MTGNFLSRVLGEIQFALTAMTGIKTGLPVWQQHRCYRLLNRFTGSTCLIASTGLPVIRFSYVTSLINMTPYALNARVLQDRYRSQD